ncbi:DNA-binding Lrp family transcriptional regulator [Ochrobactrum sp. 19YEA23]|uniref:helix-turn-helix domain-containing protein n=1 Tax=Ochrobactrum sp. 19YEA23 TaxID=3039854 RepID=UPI002479D09B|nr:DNA-binding Lrp family transcriptional regulator [Ochrobactrum sp. 19YEA23]
MKLKLDNIGALQTFVHAAEKRSFREAGQIVGLSASAVGKSVQKLEEQLGVRLFHRSTRSIALKLKESCFSNDAVVFLVNWKWQRQNCPNRPKAHMAD